MKIKVLGVALAGVLSMGIAGDALAGPGDPSIAAILASSAATDSGVTAVVSDGPDGFQIVTLFSGGSAFAIIESNASNVGGSSAVSGSVNASYGAVADSAIEAFVSSLGFNFGIPQPEASPQFTVFDREACDSVEQLEEDIRDLESDIEEESDGARNSLQDELGEVELELRKARIDCDKSIDAISATPAGYTSTNLQTTGGITINEALITAFGDGGSGTVGGDVINGVSGNFSVANPNAYRPWAIFLNSGITGLDDDRAGADRRARIFNVAVGAKIRWNPKNDWLYRRLSKWQGDV